MSRLIVHRDGRVTRHEVTSDGRTSRHGYLVGWVARDSETHRWHVQRVADGGPWFPTPFRTRRDAVRAFNVAPGSIADALMRGGPDR